MKITDMPTNHNPGNSTQQQAIRRTVLEQSCQLIEQTAIEADPYIYQYLLKAVKPEDVTYRYLKTIMEIDIFLKMFYTATTK